MNIGIPKEIKNNEFRVGAKPSDVLSYVGYGHTVRVEISAGMGAGFTDAEYKAAGAILIDAASEVWNTSDMIIKVKEPIAEEYQYFRENLILYTYLHLASNHLLTQQLLQNKVHGIAYETITDAYGHLPCLMPMSAIAGRLSVMQGVNYMMKQNGGSGVLLGGIPSVERANVTIIGAGTVGTHALKMAVGLEANVTIIDLNMARLTYLDEIYGNRITTLYSNMDTIMQSLITADMVIGAVLIPGLVAPKLIKRTHLSMMKKNAVLVDVAIDQGGCAETSQATTHADPVYTIDEVIHYCVANMPGSVSRTATKALTNTTLEYGLAIANNGIDEALRQNEYLLHGLNTYGGTVTCKAVADSLNMSYTPWI